MSWAEQKHKIMPLNGFLIFLDCTSPFEIYVTSDAKADTIAASATAISRGKFTTFLFC
jgi:hypothetical protein